MPVRGGRDEADPSPASEADESAGIAATPGEELLVADDPASFADAVITLLTDEATARRISAQEATLVVRHLSLQAVLSGSKRHAGNGPDGAEEGV